MERDLYRFAKLECEAYSAILANKDATFVDEARRRWNKYFWWMWCSERFLEHVTGRVFWSQFEHEAFGVIVDDRGRSNELTDRYYEYKEMFSTEGKRNIERTVGLGEELFEELNSLIPK